MINFKNPVMYRSIDGKHENPVMYKFKADKHEKPCYL